MVRVAGQLPYEKRGGRWPRREGGIETKMRRRGRKTQGKMGKKKGAPKAPQMKNRRRRRRKNEKSAPKAPKNENRRRRRRKGGRGGGFGPYLFGSWEDLIENLSRIMDLIENNYFFLEIFGGS